VNKAGETQLYQVEPRDADYQVDVVFIHGLGGDWQTTWGDPKSASKSWPHWIAQDIPQARVWCAQYPAAAFGWVGRNLRTLAASTSLLDRMATKHLGDRPIVLVCHSLGGLVAKQLLRTSFDLTATAESQKIAKAVRGVIFLATPHSGAGSANFIADFAKGLGLIGSLFRVTDTLTVHS
jgi:protein SERAC1